MKLFAFLLLALTLTSCFKKEEETPEPEIPVRVYPGILLTPSQGGSCRIYDIMCNSFGKMAFCGVSNNAFVTGLSDQIWVGELDNDLNLLSDGSGGGTLKDAAVSIEQYGTQNLYRITGYNGFLPSTENDPDLQTYIGFISETSLNGASTSGYSFGEETCTNYGSELCNVPGTQEFLIIQKFCQTPTIDRFGPLYSGYSTPSSYYNGDIKCLQAITPSNFIACGKSNNPDEGSVLFLLDPYGDIVTRLTYNLIPEGPVSLIQSTNELVLFGTKTALKLGLTGSLNDTIQLPLGENQVCKMVTADSQDGYIMLSSCSMFCDTNRVYRLNQNFEVVWEKRYTGGEPAILTKTPDNHFLIIGRVQGSALLTKFDISGNILKGNNWNL